MINIYRDEVNLYVESSLSDKDEIIEHLDKLFVEYEEESNKIVLRPKMEVLEVIYLFIRESRKSYSISEKMEIALKKRLNIEEPSEIKVIETVKRGKTTIRGGEIHSKKISSNSDNKNLKLTDLFKRVKMAVESNFSNQEWIEAEISNLNRHSRGHVYLDLIETNSSGNELAKSKAIIWGSQSTSIMKKFSNGTGVELSAGQKVLLKVKVSYDLKYGLSLTVQDINPEFTLGEMEAKLKKIREKLIEKGIYEKNKRLTVPYIYKNVAVISPKDAAGLMDFKVEAEKLSGNNLCNFDYYEAIFQGIHVRDSIVNAIKEVKYKIENYDALIIIRGGGAKSDLHYLNEYEIAKEICQLEIPVVVGIGHQIDHGILDEVACVKEDTPSKVIGYIYNVIYSRYNSFGLEYEKFKRKVESVISNTKNNVEIKNSQNKERIKNSVGLYRGNIERLKLKNKNDLGNIIFAYKNNIKEKKNKNTEYMFRVLDLVKRDTNDRKLRIKNKIQDNLNIAKFDIKEKYLKINKLNPIEIFKKGFSVAMNNNVAIKSSKDVNKNDDIDIYLEDGKISAKVIKINKD